MVINGACVSQGAHATARMDGMVSTATVRRMYLVYLVASNSIAFSVQE